VTIPEAANSPFGAAATDTVGTGSYLVGLMAVAQQEPQGWLAIAFGLAVLVYRGYGMYRASEARRFDGTWRGRYNLEHAETLKLRDEVDQLTKDFAAVSRELSDMRSKECPFAVAGNARCAGEDAPVPVSVGE
jgi:hypothetical protein